MSGPKVVRVVTREELILICTGRLARLDATLAAWRAACARKGLAGDDEVAATQRRRDEIAALLAADRFDALQKAVPAEITFLKEDLQRRLGKAAEAAARARTTARHEREAAGALLAALQRRGTEVPASVVDGLRAAAEGQVDAAGAMAAGFSVLSAPAQAQPEYLKALAASLKGEEASRDLAGWIARQPLSADDAPLARIEQRMAELGAELGPAQVAEAEGRLARIRANPEEARRRLLLDSLALDLGKALSEARVLASQTAILAEALAELAGLDADRAEAFAALGTPTTLAEINLRVEAVETALTVTREARAAAARRKAVLGGLASLGYEVGADLETAWVEGGQVVLRRAAQPDYGIEVSGSSAAERLQMRVVAFGSAPADPARDRDAETFWCGSIDKLQQHLARSGATLNIERALAVGAAPVKRVTLPGYGEAAAEWIAAPKKQRTLD